MSSRTWLPEKSTTFSMLMVLALVAALLPVGATRWMDSVTQPLSPVNTVLRDLVRAVTPGGNADPAAATAEVRQLTLENDAPRRQVMTLGTMLEDVDARLAALAGLRDRFQDTRTRVVIARVIGPTADRHREIVRVNKGSLAGVRNQLWVAAGGMPTPGVSGRDLLAREWLIGRVIDVRPYECDVQLVSDRQFKQTVLLARADLDQSRWEVSPAEQVLYGRGESEMEIRQAPRDFYTLGIRTVLAPASASLPLTMPLGEVTASHKIDQTQLHFDLTIKPPQRVAELAYVYIIDPGA